MRKSKFWFCCQRIFRIQDWLHFLPLVLLSAGDWPFEVFPLVASVICASMGLSIAAAINQIKDEAWEAWDAATFKKTFGLSLSNVKHLLVLFGVVGAVAASFVGIVTLIAFALMLVAAWSYSAGPRWKRIPGVGTMMNAFVFAPLAFMGKGPADHEVFVVFFACFVLLLLQNQSFHEIAHLDWDREHQIRTTAVVLGPGVTSLLAGIMGFAASALLIWFAYVRQMVFVGASAIAIAVVSIVLPISANLSGRSKASTVRLCHRWTAFAFGGLAWLAQMLSR